MSFLIFLGIIMICVISFYYYKIDNLLTEDNKIKEINEKLESENKKLTTTNLELYHNKKELEKEQEMLQKNIASTQNNIEVLKSGINKGFEEYCDILDKAYEEKEAEIEKYENMLIKAYAELQEEEMDKIAAIRKDLDKISSTRAAAIEAQRKEKEIKEQKDFYSLTIPLYDLDDIKALERVKSNLHQPRILSMLVWSTYFQKPMTALCNNVLGKDTVTGIYKITNQLNDMCYIGQSVDCAKRWKDHTKCGLDIDRPQGNKLYAAMVEDGLWNFSFELLEACPREQLDEKEKFYIELYQAKEFGYNGTGGNK